MTGEGRDTNEAECQESGVRARQQAQAQPCMLTARVRRAQRPEEFEAASAPTSRRAVRQSECPPAMARPSHVSRECVVQGKRPTGTYSKLHRRLSAARLPQAASPVHARLSKRRRHGEGGAGGGQGLRQTTDQRGGLH